VDIKSEGLPAQRPDPGQSRQDDSIWYLTVVGYQVTVSSNDQGGYRYRCEGCNAQQDRASERARALSEANEHASICRAMSSRRAKDVEDIARELYADVRAELPRIDARAAAGIALSGVVLIGAVGQAQPMPILAFMVVAAGLLTVALLLFFTVLLPVPAKASPASVRSWATFANGQALAEHLASWPRAFYHTTSAIELSSVVRTKHTRLTLGLYAGALAVLTLAAGACYSIILW
jgi:hypothetical protein